MVLTFSKIDMYNTCSVMQLDELEVSSTVSTTVGLLVDIILVYCSSSDVSPSLGKMKESAIFLSHMFVLAAKNEYLYVGQTSRPRRYRYNVENTM